VESRTEKERKKDQMTPEGNVEFSFRSSKQKEREELNSSFFEEQ
jgi:hypothetical protein